MEFSKSSRKILSAVAVVIAIVGYLVLKPLILHGINSIVYVETIKEARLDGSKYTYAEAFNRHFRGDWEYFINNYGDEIVEYSGRDSDGNTFVVRWSITPLDKKQFQYNMIHWIFNFGSRF